MTPTQLTQCREPNVSSIAQEFIEYYKQALKDAGHYASGNLDSSLESKVIYEDDKVIIAIQAPDYLTYLENGTAPHFPPIEKILEWIRVKPVIPRASADGKLPTEPQLAYLIARKISMVGTQPANILPTAMNEFDLTNRIAQAIADELTQQLDDEHLKTYFQ